MYLNTQQHQAISSTLQGYAWPGGYPVFAITKDGAALCSQCTKDNLKLIVRDTHEDNNTGWEIMSSMVNWEDTELYCDHCGKIIESAYGE